MDKKKSKVMVLGYLPPPQEGTAKITELIVNSSYLQENFRIFFLPLKKREKAIFRGKFSLINIFYNLFNFLCYVWQIILYKPDIIYLPLAQNKMGFLRDSLFILIGKLFNRKVCVHFHGGNFDLFYQQQKIFFQKYIHYILRKIDHLIVLAEKFKRQFNQFIDESKISVLYNCLPDERFNFIRQYHSDDNKFRVLFIGYLSKAKGALDLVYSIPKVIAEYKKPIEFILCGQPVDTERNITFIPEPHFGYSKMKKFILENNLNDYVKIYDEVGIEKKDELFCKSDIFVFPSYSEGMPIVVLEAMSYGLPIITTRVGALEEMLREGENCLFVEPGDYNDLANKILYLINNQKVCEKMRVENRRLVQDEYNRENFLSKLSFIWQKIL